MDTPRGAVLLGSMAERPSGAAGGLLGRSGGPVRLSALQAALVLEEAVRPDGYPLFPDAPSPARVVGELVDDGDRVFARMRPGAELGAELADLDPGVLGESALVEVIRGHARMIAHHEAQVNVAIAELASRPVYRRCTDPAGRHVHDGARVAASEVSLALSVSPRYADARVAHALRLVGELPATLAALAEGRIDAYRARVIDAETGRLADAAVAAAAATSADQASHDDTDPDNADPDADPDNADPDAVDVDGVDPSGAAAGDPAGRLDADAVAELVAGVEAAALARVESMTGPALRSFLKRKVIAAAPQVAEQRRDQARAGRRVDKPFTEVDGMGSMQLYGPIDDLAALFTAIDAAARARRDAATTADSAHPDAGVSVAALRFDVLADLGYTALAAGHLGCCDPGCAGVPQRLGTRHGRPATVHVTVPIGTLAGAGDEPGELAGYGPITAQAARRLSGEATLRRLLTDPASGALLDYGTTRYAPPQHLADHVIARDRTCRFSTCTHPAETCQLDHTIAYRSDGTGGPTAAGNLGPLHTRHHNDKTHHSFKFSQPAPGHFMITTPAGLTYHLDPEIIGPIHDPPSEPDHPGSDPPAVYDEEADPPPY